MLGSLGCMSWKWKNCPATWAGHYSDGSEFPTIAVEVIADYDLWIWHANFRMPGSNNNINVLEMACLFSDLARDVTPPTNYIIQGKEFNIGYYLADKIYLKWTTLVQTIDEPTGLNEQYFVKKHEACRKDVERAFGVLQNRFAIVANPSSSWSGNDLKDIMTACIIMHNMIIEDEREVDAPIHKAREVPTPDIELAEYDPIQFQNFVGRFREVRNVEGHYVLRNALVDHLSLQFPDT